MIANFKMLEKLWLVYSTCSFAVFTLMLTLASKYCRCFLTWHSCFTVLLSLHSTYLGVIIAQSIIFLAPSFLEIFKDFMIKLGIKPLMHLLEISIFFSLNNDLVRLAKITNNLVKHLEILSFKVIFQCLKLVESFQKTFSVKNVWLGDQLTLTKFFENFDF